MYKWIADADACICRQILRLVFGREDKGKKTGSSVNYNHLCLSFACKYRRPFTCFRVMFVFFKSLNMLILNFEEYDGTNLLIWWVRVSSWTVGWSAWGGRRISSPRAEAASSCRCRLLLSEKSEIYSFFKIYYSIIFKNLTLERTYNFLYQH